MTWLIEWDKRAKKQYEYLQENNKSSAIEKINKLLESIEERPDYGIGKPERLKWFKDITLYSRRIDEKNRLIYEVIEVEHKVVILQSSGHYNDH